MPLRLSPPDDRFVRVEPFKYLIQPVAIERDESSGRVTREIPGEVLTVFTAEDAQRAVTEFEATLAQLTEGSLNGKGTEGDGLQGGAGADRQAPGDQQEAGRGNPRRRRA